ncbi:hypothetical protein ABZ858_26215 [Streptomyces sp. NPDC047017]|uniref:hypothetical protein n=1 Tax=Streptomyces sp. NPDC047017 TaxID=3155024 RepID=UPI0033CD2F35
MRRRRRRTALTGLVVLGVSALGAALVHAAGATASAGHALQRTGTSAPAAGHTAAPEGLTPLPDGYGPTPADQAAMQAAGARARATGKPVVVSSLTTPTTQVEALPDGRFGMAVNPLPVRTEQAGRWVPVDLTLVHRADGGWAPRATAYGTTAFSGGGTGPLPSPAPAASRSPCPGPPPCPRPA